MPHSVDQLLKALVTIFLIVQCASIEEKIPYDEIDSSCIYYYNSTFLKNFDDPSADPILINSYTNFTDVLECCDNCTKEENCYAFHFSTLSTVCTLYEIPFNTSIYTSEDLGSYLGLAITK
jgi:hypothetical protein